MNIELIFFLLMIPLGILGGTISAYHDLHYHKNAAFLVMCGSGLIAVGMICWISIQLPT